MFCECGCGQITPIAPRTRTRFGHVKGEHLRFCNGHYAGKRRGRPRTPISERWREEDRGYETPCHIWTGPLNKGGAGYVSRGGRTREAYAVAWEEAHGPVPEGLELDHLCRQRDCIRDEHLEPVTHRENMRRAYRP